MADIKTIELENKIKILCPGRKCGKCQRMISRVEEAVRLSGGNAKIEIIDEIEKMLEYPTWILPTLVINDVIIARGYVPSVAAIQNQLSGDKISGNVKQIE